MPLLIGFGIDRCHVPSALQARKLRKGKWKQIANEKFGSLFLHRHTRQSISRPTDTISKHVSICPITAVATAEKRQLRLEDPDFPGALTPNETVDPAACKRCVFSESVSDTSSVPSNLITPQHTSRLRTTLRNLLHRKDLPSLSLSSHLTSTTLSKEWTPTRLLLLSKVAARATTVSLSARPSHGTTSPSSLFSCTQQAVQHKKMHRIIRLNQLSLTRCCVPSLRIAAN